VKRPLPTSLRRRFAINLREERSRQGISQEVLALKTEIARSHLSGIETCRMNASIDIIERLADALNVPAWKLFFDPGVVGEEPEQLPQPARRSRE
jgi:transcriptional regulator with XRE-family HTH domain